MSAQTMNTIAKKMGLKPGTRALVLNAAPGYLQQLAPLPDGVTVVSSGDGVFSFMQVFATRRDEIKKSSNKWLKQADPKGHFWISYPKKTSGVESDLSRDIVCEALEGSGWRPVTLVAIDEVWSALRFRPEAEVKTRK